MKNYIIAFSIYLELVYLSQNIFDMLKLVVHNFVCNLRSLQPRFTKLAKSHTSAQFFVRVYVLVRVVHIF